MRVLHGKFVLEPLLCNINSQTFFFVYMGRDDAFPPVLQVSPKGPEHFLFSGCTERWSSSSGAGTAGGQGATGGRTAQWVAVGMGMELNDPPNLRAARSYATVKRLSSVEILPIYAQ